MRERERVCRTTAVAPFSSLILSTARAAELMREEGGRESQTSVQMIGAGKVAVETLRGAGEGVDIMLGQLGGR